MHRKILISGICILSLLQTEAQYIAEVLEYRPAPGQYINTVPWGFPGYAPSVAGGINGSLCLGAFGGYVVFRFENPVENHPDNPYGVDFTIFGNPLETWSEPGVVWVMKDGNGNGLPDETWYELAGSDYYFSTTRRDARVTYSNPGDTVARDVPWQDELGNNGVIRVNSAHEQPYYPMHDSFPSIPGDVYTLTGTMIRGAVDLDHPPLLQSFRRAFGYADNQVRGQAPWTRPDNPYTPDVENSGGDAFDIDWAVDTAGEYVGLDRVDFIRVQNGVQRDGGWLGELSTEITGAVDVAADPSLSGLSELIVIEDLPLQIETPTYQLKAHVFYYGKLQKNEVVKWTTSDNDATVDGNQVLKVTRSGPLSLTASLETRPQIRATVSTVIQLEGVTSLEVPEKKTDRRIYPNPAVDFFRISGAGSFSLSLYDAGGKCITGPERYTSGSMVDIRHLSPGFYLLKADYGNGKQWFKLLKQ